MSTVGRRLVSAGGGRMELETFEVGDPGPGEVLVRVHRSQISAGTEKSHLLRDEKSPEFKSGLGWSSTSPATGS